MSKGAGRKSKYYAMACEKIQTKIGFEKIVPQQVDENMQPDEVHGTNPSQTQHQLGGAGNDGARNKTEIISIDPSKPVSNNDLLRVMMNLQNQFQNFNDTVKTVQNDMLTLHNGVHSTLVQLTTENCELKDEVVSLKKSVKHCDSEIRAANVVVTGIERPAGGRREYAATLVPKVQKAFEKELKMPNVQISTAKWCGDGKHVVVKLVKEMDKWPLFEAASLLPAGSEFTVKQDRSKETRVTRGKLGPIRDALKQKGVVVSIRDDFLVVDGKIHDYDPQTDEVYPREDGGA